MLKYFFSKPPWSAVLPVAEIRWDGCHWRTTQNLFTADKQMVLHRPVSWKKEEKPIWIRGRWAQIKSRCRQRLAWSSRIAWQHLNESRISRIHPLKSITPMHLWPPRVLLKGIKIQNLLKQSGRVLKHPRSACECETRHNTLTSHCITTVIVPQLCQSFHTPDPIHLSFEFLSTTDPFHIIRLITLRLNAITSTLYNRSRLFPWPECVRT